MKPSLKPKWQYAFRIDESIFHSIYFGQVFEIPFEIEYQSN